MTDQLLEEYGPFAFVIVGVLTLLGYIAKITVQHFGFLAQTRFAALHKKRIDLIERLYKEIWAVEREITRLIHEQSPTEQISGEQIAEINQRFDRLITKLNEFIDDYQDNEIWFTVEINKKFWSLRDEIYSALEFQHIALSLSLKEIADKVTLPQKIGFRNKANNILQEKIAPLRGEIAGHFREILGVIYPPKSFWSRSKDWIAKQIR